MELFFLKIEEIGGGDCEDLTILLNSYLENLGIETYLVLTDNHAYTLACDIDPKKLKFGSKIDSTQTEKKEHYSVKEIVGPEILRLNNGLTIRLLGIKEKPEKKQEAIDFLKRKINGQKVILKFDKEKYDNENNLLCYIYLRNKTFINAHLIKKKYALVNENQQFAYKERFIKYAKGI